MNMAMYDAPSYPNPNMLGLGFNDSIKNIPDLSKSPPAFDSDRSWEQWFAQTVFYTPAQNYMNPDAYAAYKKRNPESKMTFGPPTQQEQSSYLKSMIAKNAWDPNQTCDQLNFIPGAPWLCKNAKYVAIGVGVLIVAPFLIDIVRSLRR